MNCNTRPQSPSSPQGQPLHLYPGQGLAQFEALPNHLPSPPGPASAKPAKAPQRKRPPKGERRGSVALTMTFCVALLMHAGLMGLDTRRPCTYTRPSAVPLQARQMAAASPLKSGLPSWPRASPKSECALRLGVE
jgi:hypothetical protein